MSRQKKRVMALQPDAAAPRRAALRRALAPAEVEIVWAADVSEAIDIAARDRADLVLLDLDGPPRTGWGVVERLRTVTAGAPVMILTEDASAYVAALARHAGVVLAKPLSEGVLAREVKGLLGGPAPGSASPVHQEGRRLAIEAESERFREMLAWRYAAPYALPSPCRHWGINE